MTKLSQSLNQAVFVIETGYHELSIDLLYRNIFQSLRSVDAISPHNLEDRRLGPNNKAKRYLD